jgi:hypothetical protein
VQQQLRERARVDELGDPRDRVALLGGRLVRRQAGARFAPPPNLAHLFDQRARSDRAPDHRVGESGQQRIGAPHFAQRGNVRDERFGLLAADRRVAGPEDALRRRADGRFGHRSAALERAGPHERTDRAHERLAVAGAARLGVAQQRFGRHAVAQVTPQQPNQPRGGTDAKRVASGASPRGTRRSTARGMAAARTSAPSASRSEQR